MGARRKNPLLGAAVVKLMLTQRSDGAGASTLALYEGILRDLDLRDADVDEFLRTHRSEVEAALRGQGRRGA